MQNVVPDQRLARSGYVFNGSSVGPLVPVASNCFGAPVFHVGAGGIAYLGDFIPYLGVKLSTGLRLSKPVYAGQMADAGATLAKRQPARAAAMIPAWWRTGLTYACSAIVMDRADLPGVEAMSDPVAPAARMRSAATPGGDGARWIWR